MTDPAHGPRAAEFTTKLRGDVFDLDDHEFRLLYRACDGHMSGDLIHHAFDGIVFRAVDRLRHVGMKAVARYAGPKGNLQFPLDEPIPYSLIERIVKLRVKQDIAKAAKKKPTLGRGH